MDGQAPRFVEQLRGVVVIVTVFNRCCYTNPHARGFYQLVWTSRSHDRALFFLLRDRHGQTCSAALVQDRSEATWSVSPLICHPLHDYSSSASFGDGCACDLEMTLPSCRRLAILEESHRASRLPVSCVVLGSALRLLSARRAEPMAVLDRLDEGFVRQHHQNQSEEQVACCSRATDDVSAARMGSKRRSWTRTDSPAPAQRTSGFVRVVESYRHCVGARR